MIIYFCLYISVLYAMCFDKCKKKINLMAVFILTVAFFLSTCRAYFLGADYDSYVELYENNMYRVYGWGWQLINYLAKLLGNLYVYLAFTVNIFIFTCVFLCYKKQVQKTFFMFAVFLWMINPYGFIQSSFNMLRQGCAMTVLLAASGFLGNKAESRLQRNQQYLAFLILLFCAAGFHKSAWIFILLIPFTMIKWQRKLHVLLLLICSSINILAHNDAFMGVLARCFGFESYVSARGGSIFDFPLYALFIICFTGFLILRYNELFTEPREKWYVDLYICSLCVLLLLVKNDQ
ncbi:MAG: EpsG family protein, partial [Ruminococcus flavefaciens]|nr:EpsG family protein [Ruminococcus flavefaciens]